LFLMAHNPRYKMRRDPECIPRTRFSISPMNQPGLA
jgi:hypothetical protein